MRWRWTPIAAMTIAALLSLPRTGAAAACAAPGSAGNGAGGGIVNTYYAGLSDPGSGTTGLTLGAARGAGVPIAAGDLVLLIQMQHARINRQNSDRYGDGAAGDPATGFSVLAQTGRYEFARAVNGVPLSGGTLTLAAGTVYAYESRPATGGRGQHTWQVVRVPQYADFDLTGTLTASPWDGATGGVAAIDVGGRLRLAGGSIDVSGRGFRGGGARQSTSGSGSNTDYRTPSSNGANGSKGEGIAGTPRLVFTGPGVTDNGTEGYPSGSFARGAPANAGGGGTDGRPSANDQNTGGGGGGGWGDGGRGGHAWCPGGPSVCPQTGGFGGSGVTVQGADRITMGGGGGAGTTNNGAGPSGSGIETSGAAGGGIVIVRAGRIEGSGTLRADGAASSQLVGNDGSGGGGAGGTIVLTARSVASATLTASARGGRGGSNNNSTPHGPGGGGGGGLVLRSANLLGVLVDVSGGQPGTTDGNPAPFTSNYGATAGDPGTVQTIAGLDVPGLSSGGECSIVVNKAFTPAAVSAGTASRLTLTLRNPNPTLALGALAVTDSYPAGLANAVTPNAATDCGGSVSAVASAGEVSLAGAGLAAGASCTVDVDVVAVGAGSLVNTVPVDAATATIGGQPVRNLLPAEATLTVFEPLTVTKTVAIISDPVNGTSGPYALPGAIAEYTVTITNPSSVPVDDSGLTVTDLLPPDTVFLNIDLGAGLPVVLQNAGGASLTLAASGIAFSDDGGATYAYSPSAGPDPNVEGLRVTPGGVLAAGGSATLRFRVAVE